MKINGYCYCGLIKISGIANSDNILACHCTDCQVFTGAPFRAVALCKESDFTISGTPKEFVKTGDSGNKRIQAFCNNCGTHLFASDLDKSNFNIRVGCLDQRNDLIPQKHIFGSSAQKWIHEVLNSEWFIAEPGGEKLKE